MRKTLAGLAAATVLLLAACSGDDDDSGDEGQPPSEQEQGAADSQPEGEAPADDAAGGEVDAPSGDTEEAFCAWFAEASPHPEEWDQAEVESLEPPAEIAETFEAIVGGDTDLSLLSELSRWATDNCF